MEMFTELSHDRDAVVQVATQNHQGIRVEDDRLVLGKEERHCHSNGEWDKKHVDELTALTRHLGDDQSTLQAGINRQVIKHHSFLLHTITDSMTLTKSHLKSPE